MSSRVRILRSFRPSGLSGCEWLDAAICAVKLVRDAGSLAPVPYIEKAAEIVLRILQVKRNGENFRELAEDMVDMVKMIEETLGQPRSQESRFPHTCNHLLAELTQLETKLDQIRRKSQSRVRWFLFSSAIHEEIEGERAQLKKMLDKFQTALQVDMRQMQSVMQEMQVTLHQYLVANLPAQVVVPSIRPGQFTLVDAMNVRVLGVFFTNG
ncbi:hypothetical protein B0H14DRAFT_3453384 [Mycena olivaceomarginata]|nr:hypothetical protein B0H14DRAFT_3453384 [Mycena olivaceomarginata]